MAVETATGTPAREWCVVAAWGSQTRPWLPGVAGLAVRALVLWSREGCLLWSFVYLVVRNLFALVWLLGRPRRSKGAGDSRPPARAGDPPPADLAAEADAG